MGDVFDGVGINYEKRTIELFCHLDQNSYPEIRRGILDMSKEKEPIWLLLDSPGGDLFAGTQTFALLRSCASPVIGVVMGQASSAAALALQGCKVRIALGDLSIVGLHEPTAWVGPFEGKSETFVRQNEQAIKAIMSAFTTRDSNPDYASRIEALISAKTALFTEDALKEDLVDAVIIDRKTVRTIDGEVAFEKFMEDNKLPNLELPF